MKILALATKGHRSNEEERILALLETLKPDNFPFDRSQKLKSTWNLYKEIRRSKPDIVVVEGTGSAVGILLIFLSMFRGQKYVVSSGDAVADWLTMRTHGLLYPLFFAYEVLLYHFSSGFIGWTPYLVGRALSFGAKRATFAAGFNPFPKVTGLVRGRQQIRKKLGIPNNALVVGIAGSLAWSSRRKYCYGLELANALSLCGRDDVYGLIVGDGPGLRHIYKAISPEAKDRLILPGAVKQSELPHYYAAMDIGLLPQSTDAVGSVRYTTKLVEYLVCKTPVAMTQIPASYDLDEGWLWRVDGEPWSKEFAQHLARILETLTPEELTDKKAHTKPHAVFEKEPQVDRVTGMLLEIAGFEKPKPLRRRRAA